MAPKVDSLNIVSKTKSMPIVFNHEAKDNIEVFTTDSINTNIDEVDISNTKPDINSKKETNKTNNKLVGASIALGTIAALIIGGRFTLKNPKILTKVFNKMLIANSNKGFKKGIPLLTEYISKDFITIKSQLLSSQLDEKFLQQINKAKSSKKIAKICKSFEVKELTKVTKANELILDPTISTVEKQKIITQLREDYFSKIFNLHKALSIKSTNPRVIEIENTLKSQYGMEFVSLKDDVVHAEKVLKACEIMCKNGDKIPRNYIVTNMQNGIGQCLKTESTILHSSTKLEKLLPSARSKHFSTNSELHIIIHEFGHSLHPSIINTIEIPKHLQHVPAGVSNYANCGSNAELFAELFAKIRLTPKNVTEEELELFEFLKNTVL